MERSLIASIIRRWWAALIASAIIGAVSGAVYSREVDPTYEATVRILVGPINADANTLRAAGQTSQTYAELATNKAVFERATGSLDLPGVETAVVRAVASDVTRLLRITVQSSEPRVASAVANAVAFELVVISQQEQTEASIEDGQEADGGGASVDPAARTVRVGDIRIISNAEEPSTPIAPNRSLVTIMFANVGLLVAVIAVLVIERSRRVVRSEADIDRHGVRVIRAPSLWTAIGSAPGFDAGAAETFRGAAIDVLTRLDPAAVPPTILVSGAGDRDTSADAAVNLAFAFARAPMVVALVDVDRNGARLLDRIGDPLPVDLTIETEAIDERAQLRRRGRLVSPLGSALDCYELEAVANPLTASTVGSLLQRLSRDVDLVVLYAPPARWSISALACATHASHSFLVVTRNQARIDDTALCIEALDRSSASGLSIFVDERTGRKLVRRLVAGRRPAAETVTAAPGAWELPPRWSLQPAAHTTSGSASPELRIGRDGDRAGEAVAATVATAAERAGEPEAQDTPSPRAGRRTRPPAVRPNGS
ncbi:MAG: GNVR domain-containing protein [Acidimicrobiia bacterium]